MSRSTLLRIVSFLIIPIAAILYYQAQPHPASSPTSPLSVQSGALAPVTHLAPKYSVTDVWDFRQFALDATAGTYPDVSGSPTVVFAKAVTFDEFAALAPEEAFDMPPFGTMDLVVLTGHFQVRARGGRGVVTCIWYLIDPRYRQVYETAWGMDAASLARVTEAGAR